MGKLELKINIRDSTTGNTKRTFDGITNFQCELKFNSFASSFSFDFYFDPKNQEHAEIFCVSHFHEIEIFYNNTLFLTGWLVNNDFINPGKAELVSISGYSKPGILNKCDIPFSSYPLETDGLSLRQIINKFVPIYNIGVQIDDKVKRLDKAFVSDNEGEDDEDNLGKSASESSQNVASYLSSLAQERNVVLSHTASGKVWITTPATKGTPILNFDFTGNDPNNDAFKIPGIKTHLKYNGEGLHTDITVIQQASDEEGSNATQSEPLQNPIIHPIKQSVLYMPKVVTMSSGSQFTANQLAKYELGREIRENVTLSIDMGMIDIDGELIRPNNTITVKDPSIFLYNKSTWYIQSLSFSITPNSETCTLNCVLPFGYDFDYTTLKNVFIDPHENFPRTR